MSNSWSACLRVGLGMALLLVVVSACGPRQAASGSAAAPQAAVTELRPGQHIRIRSDSDATWREGVVAHVGFADRVCVGIQAGAIGADGSPRGQRVVFLDPAATVEVAGADLQPAREGWVPVRLDAALEGDNCTEEP